MFAYIRNVLLYRWWTSWSCKEETSTFCY